MCAHHYCRLDDRRLRYYRDRQKTLAPLRTGMATLLGDLATLDWSGADDFVRRDGIDMARAILGRLLEGEVANLGLAIEARRHLPPEASPARKDAQNAEIRRPLARLAAYLQDLSDVLEASPEFSLNDSLARIRAAGPSNPDFERTLKKNANNPYCRSQIFELIRHVNLKQFAVLSDFLEEAMSAENGFAGWEKRTAALDARLEAVATAFDARSLSEMAPDCPAAYARLPEVLRRAASATRNDAK